MNVWNDDNIYLTALHKAIKWREDMSLVLTKEWFPKNIAQEIYPSAAAISNYLLVNTDDKGWIKSKPQKELIIETETGLLLLIPIIPHILFFLSSIIFYFSL